MSRRYSFALSCIAFCALVLPAITRADPVQVGDVIRLMDREGSTGGGEFAVAYANTTTELFRTFCVQRTEFIDFNAAGFNIVGMTDHAVAGNDPLDEKTAFLYDRFRKGTLPGYDISTTALRIASADALQLAIWYIEQEAVTLAQLNANALATSFYNRAVDAVSIGGLTDEWVGVGIGNVRVMNLTWATSRSGFSAGDNAQDQLVLVPSPHPALAGMSILGLVGVTGLIRRRTAPAWLRA